MTVKTVPGSAKLGGGLSRGAVLAPRGQPPLSMSPAAGGREEEAEEGACCRSAGGRDTLELGSAVKT